MACSDATPLFEMQDGVFRHVSQFVPMRVVVALRLAVLARRNLRPHSLLRRLCHDGIALAAFNCNQMLGFHPLDRRAGAQNPEDRVEKTTVVLCNPAALASLSRKVTPKLRPRMVAWIVATTGGRGGHQESSSHIPNTRDQSG